MFLSRPAVPGVGFQAPGELSGHNLKLSVKAEGREKPKKEAGHSRLVDGTFRKQMGLTYKVILGGNKMNRSLYPPSKP